MNIFKKLFSRRKTKYEIIDFEIPEPILEEYKIPVNPEHIVLLDKEFVINIGNNDYVRANTSKDYSTEIMNYVVQSTSYSIKNLNDGLNIEFESYPLNKINRYPDKKIVEYYIAKVYRTNKTGKYFIVKSSKDDNDNNMYASLIDFSEIKRIFKIISEKSFNSNSKSNYVLPSVFLNDYPLPGKYHFEKCLYDKTLECYIVSDKINPYKLMKPYKMEDTIIYGKIIDESIKDIIIPYL